MSAIILANVYRFIQHLLQLECRVFSYNDLVIDIMHRTETVHDGHLPKMSLTAVTAVTRYSESRLLLAHTNTCFVSVSNSQHATQLSIAPVPSVIMTVLFK